MKKLKPKRTKFKFWKYLYMAPDNYAICLVTSLLYQIAIIINPKTEPVRNLLPGNYNKQKIFLNQIKQHEKNRLINRSNDRSVRGNTRAQHGHRKRDNSTNAQPI